MPRIGLKTLLRDLNAANVRHYRKEGATVEVEFWTPTAQQADPAAAREDRREAYLEARQRIAHEGKEMRDPLKVATEDLSIDGDEMEN